MKSFATFLVIGLFTAVQAQDQCSALVAKIPTCAVQCIDKAASSVGCSGPTDLACQCKNTDKINAQALNCVLSGCGAQQGLEAQSAAAAVCSCVASAGSKPASSAAPASTAAPSSSAAAASVPASSAATSKPALSTSATGGSPPFPTASQISDGQVQAGTAGPSAGKPSSTPVAFPGAGVAIGASMTSVILAFAAVVAAL